MSEEAANAAQARLLRKALGEPEDEPLDDFERPPVHRVIPAKGAPPLRVVDPLGWNPPAEKPPIDFDSLRSAGPMVPPPMKPGGRFDELLSLLPIGESRALPREEETSLRSAVKALKRHRGSPRRFAIRRLSDTEVGIWRLPDAPKEESST